jgi:exosortase/archaeosortase family protein
MPVNKFRENFFPWFLVKFILLFALLYFFNIAFIGITSQGNFYISFLDKHLNYINWLRDFILHTSNFITRIFGFDTKVEEPYLLRIQNGPAVRMVYACIGYGVFSLWTAFVIAYEGKLKQKLLWFVIGCVTIFVVNCFRVSMFLIALEKKWNVNRFIEHHDLYNIISYLLIFLLIYFYTNRTPIREAETSIQG